MKSEEQVKVEMERFMRYDKGIEQNPLSVVVLLTKVLRYQGLIYNRINVMQEQLDHLTKEG